MCYMESGYQNQHVSEETRWATDFLLVSKGEVVPLWIRGTRLGTLSPCIQRCPEVTLPVVLLLRCIEGIGFRVIILLATDVSPKRNWGGLITFTSYWCMRR